MSKLTDCDVRLVRLMTSVHYVYASAVTLGYRCWTVTIDWYWSLVYLAQSRLFSDPSGHSLPLWWICWVAGRRQRRRRRISLLVNSFALFANCRQHVVDAYSKMAVHWRVQRSLAFAAAAAVTNFQILTHEEMVFALTMIQRNCSVGWACWICYPVQTFGACVVIVRVAAVATGLDCLECLLHGVTVVAAVKTQD